MLPTNPLLRATAPAGPHLPVATLRQYAAGTLSGAARHRVEAHTLACPRCADILEGLLQTPPATTDQALAQLQQRLRLRVQQAEAVRPALPRLGHRWLVPQLAAAATLLFGLLAGGWYIWQQRRATPAAEVAAIRPAPSATEAPAVAAEVPTAASVPSAPASRRPTVAGAPSHATSRPAARVLTDGLYATEQVAPAVSAAPATGAVGRVGNDSINEVVQAAPMASRPGAADSATLARQPGEAPLAKAKRASLNLEGGRTRMSLMPAAPAVPPTPASGYPAWRDKVRRAAAEFKPEEGQRPLSGTVQLRLLIGPDGKIQQVRVLHGLRADYDEAAQELVCDGPAWIPGIGGGKRAAQTVDVGVLF